MAIDIIHTFNKMQKQEKSIHETQVKESLIRTIKKINRTKLFFVKINAYVPFKAYEETIIHSSYVDYLRLYIQPLQDYYMIVMHYV